MCQKESQKILVVDDDADIREVLSEVLVESGHEVMTASNGSRRIASIAAAPPSARVTS